MGSSAEVVSVGGRRRQEGVYTCRGSSEDALEEGLVSLTTISTKFRKEKGGRENRPQRVILEKAVWRRFLSMTDKASHQQGDP